MRKSLPFTASALTFKDVWRPAIKNNLGLDQTPGGALLEILGGDVPPGSPSPDLISEQKIGTLRSNDATTTRTSLKKWICVLSVFIAIIRTPYFVKCRRTLLELKSQGPYPSSKREIKFRRWMFMSSVKREIRYFHVVVVQKRAKKCTKKRDARAKLLFCL